YVRQDRGDHEERPERSRAIFFVSIDCDAFLVTRVARRFLCLPYHDADIVREERDGMTMWHAARAQATQPGARLRCAFRPAGAPLPCGPGSLDEFLLERYRFHVVDSRFSPPRLLAGDVQHEPWRRQDAVVTVLENGVPAAAGLAI